MKKLLYLAVAAIAALSSCSNDDVIVNENENQNQKVEAPVFTATIEGEAETRTTLVQNTTTGKYTKVNWANGDKININGKIYSTTSTGSTASFTPDDGEASTVSIASKNVYIASYPSTIALSVTTVGSTPTIAGTFPATQTYDAATNGIGNIPMAAVSTSTELNFKNVCAVLAITVPNTEMSTVKSIMVTSDKQMNGNCCVAFTDATTFEGPYLAFIPSQSLTDEQKSVTLDCGTSGVSIGSGESHTFYIAIPAQTYSYLTIYLSADGTTYKEAMATKVAAGLSALARNKIYPIDYEKNAVQLWSGGPYFATMNVGETTVGGNTVKYAWGATSADGAPNAKSNNDADTYDLDHDTAYKIWGSAWRMPTKADFEAMSSKCTLGYISGGTFTFTGNTTGYSSAKVSFPKDSDQIIAQYWTSSVDGNGNVYYGSFQLNQNGNPLFDYIGGSKPVDTNNNNLKYFVRAVLR